MIQSTARPGATGVSLVVENAGMLIGAVIALYVLDSLLLAIVLRCKLPDAFAIHAIEPGSDLLIAATVLMFFFAAAGQAS